MSKVLRRPMFRKGGNVGEGIMTGIVDREGYDNGSDPFTGRTIPTLKDLTDESLQALTEAAGPRGGFDPLTSFLLAYGPAAAMENRGGGTIANLIAAAKEPSAALIKSKADEDKFQRGLRTRATASAIEKRDKMMETEAERKFKSDLFEKETNRLMDLQENDFSNEAKVLGLKQDFSADQATKERELKLNMQKIDNALRSDLLDEEQENKMKILKKQYENSLGLLAAEQTGSSSIDSLIEKSAQKLVDDEVVGSIYEATNQQTWKYKTSGDLMKKGYNVADEVLSEEEVLNTKKFESRAKKLSKKSGNEGRIYYFPKGNKYYQLKNGKFEPFDISGNEIIEGQIDSGNEIIQEDGITNYGYGTGDTRDQNTAIRQLNAQLKGPAFGGESQAPDMTRDQKSAYERYLSDYRNR
tara:strand:- start:785 stop:2020 length:1236 start_codon:yes stop_codon:yes gene_type:complete